MMLVPRRNSFDLFDDFIEDEFFPRNSFFSKRERNLMKTDIKEKKDKYILDIDLPGFKKENINAKKYKRKDKSQWPRRMM